MKKLISALMIGMMIFTAGCSSNTGEKPAETPAETPAATPANKLEEIKAAGKLIVGTSADYPPYEFHMIVDGKDQIVGFDVEVAKEIAKGLGVELELQDMGFDAVLAGVGTGLIDIGVAGINPTPERDEAMDFSDVYYKASHTILVKAENADQYKTVDDLKGKTIGAQIGTVQESVAKEEIEGANVKSLPKVTDLVLELKTGMLDAIILEIPVAESYAKQNDDLVAQTDVVFEKIEGGSTVVTANDQPELMAEINKIIAQLLEEGKIDQFVADANALAEQITE